MKNLTILGSTGSIGTQTLEVVRSNRKDFNITALAVGTNIEQLEQQIIEFMPDLVCVWEEDKAKELALKVHHLPVTVEWGMNGLIACATHEDADIVVAAVVGMIGIRPVVEAIKAGKDIALANKETLVTAGHIIMPLIEQYKVALLPVDSEHSAIFQALNGEKASQVSKIILTASGGPFRGKTQEELQQITVEQALNHPNWTMGRKVTIDSSTMVNKGLEVMEAKWLFDVEFDAIQVIIQPQSVIHSMVEFVDGAIMAQLGTPDMKLPIQYALYYPDRKFLSGARLDFATLGSIDFQNPDFENFPGLALAYEAGKTAGSMPTVFNAANEKAVDKFLDGKIPYLEITKIIEYCMHQHHKITDPTIADILEIEKETYRKIDQKWR